MTIEEFAKAANVAEITVRNWIKAGIIHAEKRRYAGFRSRWYISPTELKKIESNGN